ncbi:MAG: TIM barrel protein [Planctomycetaceae bacterium]|nr:TIM barrel protein [Planctomycetaceae bacterium]
MSSGTIKRRTFLQTTLAGGLLAACGTPMLHATDAEQPGPLPKLAPHLGQFRNLAGEDRRAQLDFISAQGFPGLQENGLAQRTYQFQQALRRELEGRGLQLGPFVGVAEFAEPLFGSAYPTGHRRFGSRHHQALQIAYRSGASSFIVIPGKRDTTVPYRRQFSRAVEFYQRLTERCEQAQVTLLLEPVHHGSMNSPMFLSSHTEAIELCARVNHPHLRLLFDVYQQDQQLADLEAGLTEAAPWIGHVELGDSLGRKEPGTGSIDFPRLFSILRDHRYDGLLGMEHGTSLSGKAGEIELLASYQRLGLIEPELITH